MATQRTVSTTRHGHTEILSGDTYQPQYSPRPAKREGSGRGKLAAAQMQDLELEIAQPPRASTHHLKLGEDLYVQ